MAGRERISGGPTGAPCRVLVCTSGGSPARLHRDLARLGSLGDLECLFADISWSLRRRDVRSGVGLISGWGDEIPVCGVVGLLEWPPCRSCKWPGDSSHHGIPAAEQDSQFPIQKPSPRLLARKPAAPRPRSRSFEIDARTELPRTRSPQGPVQTHRNPLTLNEWEWVARTVGVSESKTGRMTNPVSPAFIVWPGPRISR